MSAENILNTIAKGTVIHGNITTEGDISVQGKVMGTLVCKSKLVVGTNGSIEGNVDAKNANISGEVKGNVVVRDLLHLLESGRVYGDIFTEKLIVQVGALFTGSCKMGKSAKTETSKAQMEISKDSEMNGTVKGEESSNAFINSALQTEDLREVADLQFKKQKP